MTDVELPSPVIGPSRTLGHFVDTAAFARFGTAYTAAMATLPAAEPSTIPTTAGLVRAYRFGSSSSVDGAPLVLLSGRDSSTPMWAPVLDGLIGLGRTTYSLDSVGGPGASTQTSPLDTAEKQAGWVAEAVRGLGVERAHLVGHSLGAWLAVQVARHRPDVVASVTAIDPPRVFTELRLGFVAAGVTASLGAVPDRLRRRLIGWIAGAPMSDDDPVDRLGWTSIETFRARQQPPQLPTPDDLAAIGVPLLVVLAGRSSVQDAEKAARGAAVVPGARVDVWPEAGHCLHAEDPARFVAGLADFLADLGA